MRSHELVFKTFYWYASVRENNAFDSYTNGYLYIFWEVRLGRSRCIKPNGEEWERMKKTS